MPSRLSAGGTITEVTRDLRVSKWPLAHWMPRAAERSIPREPKTMPLETPRNAKRGGSGTNWSTWSCQRDIFKHSLGHLVILSKI